MTIDDLAVGTTCTIQINVGNSRIFHDTVIRAVYPKKSAILVDALCKNGKYIQLENVENHLVINVENSKPEIFKRIRPILFEDKKLGRRFYCIQIKQNSIPYNRRESYRCFVGERLNVQIGDNRRTFECVLKDVSATGFALVFDKINMPTNYHSWANFHAVYNLSNEDVGGLRFGVANLKGEVVRCEEMSDEKVLFGCRHLNVVHAIEPYIRDRERCEAQKKSHRLGVGTVMSGRSRAR